MTHLAYKISADASTFQQESVSTKDNSFMILLACVRKVNKLQYPMPINLQIVVKGIPEDHVKPVSDSLAQWLSFFLTIDSKLDLRRLSKIIITDDLARELHELSVHTVSGNLITHTNEEYAQAVAKMVTLPNGNNYEIILVIGSHIATLLIPVSADSHYSDFNRQSVHILHHELYHIHDQNKQIDALSAEFLKTRYVGKDMYTFPPATACWAEFYANRMCSTTADEGSLSDIVHSFSDAITRAKPLIDEAVLSYRYHGDVNTLLGEFQRHGVFLLRSAAYTLGYVEGLGCPLSEISSEAFDCLSGSYFEPIWDKMHAALREMLSLYPDQWNSISVFNGLANVVEEYYSVMGLDLSNTLDGRAYVSVPFRPETTP